LDQLGEPGVAEIKPLLIEYLEETFSGNLGALSQNEEQVGALAHLIKLLFSIERSVSLNS